MRTRLRVGHRFRVAIAGLAIAMSGAPAMVSAQSPNPNEAGFEQAAEPSQGGGGDPWYGYAAFFFVAALGLFVVCKSARRGYTD